jgi:toxin-antitoxin system PIN domain toxin
MIGLDSNILVQLAFVDHPAHAKTVALINAETAKDTKLVLPSFVINEFLHVVTDARRFTPPLTMIEALDWVEEFLNKPAVTLVEPDSKSFHRTLELLREFNLGRKRILDTHLAAVLLSCNIQRLLTSNQADFAIFKDLETISP